MVESTAIHAFIEDSDTEALADQREEGHNAPVLLTTLALSEWTHLLLPQKSTKDGSMDKLVEARSSKLCYRSTAERRGRYITTKRNDWHQSNSYFQMHYATQIWTNLLRYMRPQLS